MTGTRPATCSSTVVMTLLALVVGQHELLGEVRQDADAVEPASIMKSMPRFCPSRSSVAVVVEDGRRDRKYAAIGALRLGARSWIVRPDLEPRAQ